MATRWGSGDRPSGSDYDDRWAALAAAGEDPHGEATFVASLGPASVFDAGCGTGRVAIELDHRVVKLHVTDGTDEWGRTVVRGAHDAPLHRMMVTGASGVSTARDMARFYAALAAGGELDGVRILRAETVARLLEIEVDGELVDTFNAPVRLGLGFELGGLTDPRRHWPGA